MLRYIVFLDYGCGTMPYAPLFSRIASEYIGADLQDNPLASVTIDPATGNVNKEMSSVDIVLSTQVLEHVDSPSLYLREAYRICKKDGFLLLIDTWLLEVSSGIRTTIGGGQPAAFVSSWKTKAGLSCKSLVFLASPQRHFVFFKMLLSRVCRPS